MIHRIKRGNSSSDDISILTLEGHFREKFEQQEDSAISDVRERCKRDVDAKYHTMMSTVSSDKVYTVSECWMFSWIRWDND